MIFIVYFSQSKSFFFVELIYIYIYIDDIIISGNDPARINALKAYLHTAFSIKDLGPLKYFLGLEVVRAPGALYKVSVSTH